MLPPNSPGSRLRALMDRSCVPIPGAFNALCSLAIRDAGFEACYISGAATSVAAGVPDVGLLTLEHFCRRVFGKELKLRLRPSYFPFVEPGAEYDISCIFCGGAGCSR